MFLITLTYKKSLAEVEKLIIDHRSYLDECYAKNQLIVSGPQNPRTGGILISQLNDRNEVEELIKCDPFYIHEIADYMITEFIPVKYHPNFADFV